MNSRQRVLVYYLSKQESSPKLHLMKLLFLCSKSDSVSEITSYGFVPYLHGPFSFEMYRDIGSALAAYIEEDGRDLRIRQQCSQFINSEIARLAGFDRSVADAVWIRFGAMSVDQLLDHVYLTFPWYSSRSRYGTGCRTDPGDIAVYTIGYEGRSVDRFFDLVLANRLTRIIDVRRNAYSHKYGFTGRDLSSICTKLGVDYIHIPALGIDAKLRKNLSAPGALEALLDMYEQGLDTIEKEIESATQAVATAPSALLCFEASVSCCHRGKLVKRIAARSMLPIRNL